jgi:hypothetical protein
MPLNIPGCFDCLLFHYWILQGLKFKVEVFDTCLIPPQPGTEEVPIEFSITPNIKFHENTFNGSLIITRGQTYRRRISNAKYLPERKRFRTSENILNIYLFCKLLK